MQPASFFKKYVQTNKDSLKIMYCSTGDKNINKNMSQKHMKNEYRNFPFSQNSSRIIRKNIFACLFSIHNIISLSRHKQVCLSGLHFERYFSHHQEKYLSKCSPLKHTCSWCDQLIIAELYCCIYNVIFVNIYENYIGLC